MSANVSAWLFVLIGIGHSVIGETMLVMPLIANKKWKLDAPRVEDERSIRFTWHAVTLAWFALAAIQLGVAVGVGLGIVALLSAVAMLLFLREHPVWPLFFVVGFYALDSADALPHEALQGLAIAGASVLIAAGILHVAWAFGVKALRAHTYPEDPETRMPLANPGALVTLAAAAAAFAFGGLILVVGLGSAPALLWWCCLVAVIVAAVRMMGDGKHFGFTKTIKDTAFGRADSRLYTPIFAFLALAGGAALQLAGTP